MPVARVQRPCDLRRIAQAQHDFWDQFEIVEYLVPERHQADCARILEAEIAFAHSLFEKRDDLAFDLMDARIRPPGDRQREVVERAEIAAVEECENTVVKLDDLPPLPMAFSVRRAAP